MELWIEKVENCYFYLKNMINAYNITFENHNLNQPKINTDDIIQLFIYHFKVAIVAFSN
jgi:hypothetical protein